MVNRIDKKRLDKYNSLIKAILNTANELSGIYNGFTIQEKALAGGILLQTVCPWSESRTSHLVGSNDVISILFNQAAVAVRRPTGQSSNKSIFKNGDNLKN
jgi:hypothetical protein